MQYFFSSIHRHEAYRQGLDMAIDKMVNEVAGWVTAPVDITGKELPASTIKPEPAATEAIDKEKADWQQATAIHTAEAYRLFLQHYPAGKYTQAAEQRWKELTDAEKQEPAPLPEAIFPYPDKRKKIVAVSAVVISLLLLFLLMKNFFIGTGNVKLQAADSTRPDSNRLGIDVDSLHDGVANFLDTGNAVTNRSTPNEEDPGILTLVEREAQFPGGLPKWRKFMRDNIKTGNLDSLAPLGSHTVVIRFVVDKRGNISDIEPLTNLGYGMEKEAIRVIKKSPLWVPARQNGRIVTSYKKQPVTFVLTPE